MAKRRQLPQRQMSKFVKTWYETLEFGFGVWLDCGMGGNDIFYINCL